MMRNAAHPWLRSLSLCPIIAVIRSQERDGAYQMAVKAIESGLSCIEIAWSNESVTLSVIAQLRQTYPTCSIGVGTIFQPTQLEKAIAAGSQFAFSPISEESLIRYAHSLNFPLVPGAFTPTEIWQAWNWGAIAVKVFPIKSLGEASYLKCLRDALGPIPLIPTGGVTPENAMTLLQAGAIAVGLSSSLFPHHANGTPDLEQTQTLIQQLLQAYQNVSSASH